MKNVENTWTNNEEQFEAMQMALDARNNSFKKTLSEKDQSKIDAVEKARKILTESDVPFIGFFEIKCEGTEEGKDVCVQFNNWGELFLGKEDSLKKANLSHKRFVSSFCSYLEGFIRSYRDWRKIRVEDYFPLWVKTFMGVED